MPPLPPLARAALAALLLAVGASAPASGQASPEPFTLDGPSGAYPIHVTLPPGYDPERPDPYPVLYYADAWWLAEAVAGAGRLTVLTGNAEPFVSVGVGTDGDADDWNRQRNRDLTPSPFRPRPGLTLGVGGVVLDSASTGGAPAFLAFLRDAVVPRVEAAYHVDPARRAWLGHSFGGLFGAWARSVAPGLFRDLILVSPSAFWDNGFNGAGEVLRAPYEPGGRAFLAFGSVENGPIRRSVPALANVLGEAADVTLVEYPGRDHHSVLMPALWDGVVRVFGPERGGPSPGP